MRGSIGGIKRYASIAQGPEEHGVTSTEGTALSASIDSSSIFLGELQMGPLASAIERRRKLFVSLPVLAHGAYPTAFAFQFPQSQVSRSPSQIEPSQSDSSLGDSSASPATGWLSAPLSTSISTRSWVLSTFKWWNWDFTWWDFMRDAQHTPAITVMGKCGLGHGM